MLTQGCELKPFGKKSTEIIRVAELLSFQVFFFNYIFCFAQTREYQISDSVAVRV